MSLLNLPTARPKLHRIALRSLLGAALLLGACDDDDSQQAASAGSSGRSSAMRDAAIRPIMGSAGKTADSCADAGRPPPDAGNASSQYDGREVFRHDTFRDEALWTDQLRMHEVIASALDPMTALGAGLKVDSEAVPASVLQSADLSDPATTVALLKLGAVVGVEGVVNERDELVSVGIACALCHSDVDDSVMEGIGKRLDGHANRDLDPGLILSLSPAFADDAKAKAVLTSWGKGRYDARWNQDGMNAPVLIPPIYGLQGVPLETYTGDGPVSYWNAYVAVTQMGGIGQFFDPRVEVEVMRTPDQVTPKLPALYRYQISLQPPAPPAGSFDGEAAARGKALFAGSARCASCHSGAARSDAADHRLHAAEETGMEPLHAQRSATGKYRTTPLRALWQHPPYFHDGSAATLPDVVDHYASQLKLSLSAGERADLVEYLKSL